MSKPSFSAVVPAAGIGSRMQSALPKQYLSLNGKAVIEHSLKPLLDHDDITHVVVVLSKDDTYFSQLAVACHPKIVLATGGKERVHSVLAGLTQVNTEWVLVHDAARPCLTRDDIDALLQHAKHIGTGAILATLVRDTMKRGNDNGTIAATVCRENLWHALTPQMFLRQQLQQAITQALQQGVSVTDEASAMEASGYQPQLIDGRSDNIKVTRPEDMLLAELYLSQQQN
ncbi:2-C-methyl-D-erythritol 4-phosphate cytidylyltransferase [Motilimonas pumila]|uniref:2-C-methyl-D-erythritol 4-phosphate cytidylyltransferase n=1 Tax=Motilimonas pumila TaxID=2303987 RepID=A0A418YAK5_9GAMM|nr:2-C-methyl-D-erythritol 4-phosphate cytidylyltransferase [Motilimonas pumila]RJG39990.1 2-C-methyl-D-erythritol 4-phosphate cytidylyltransferase [Motilimonas pumila]